jgi:hypothetical protein
MTLREAETSASPGGKMIMSKVSMRECNCLKDLTDESDVTLATDIIVVLYTHTSCCENVLEKGKDFFTIKVSGIETIDVEALGKVCRLDCTYVSDINVVFPEKRAWQYSSAVGGADGGRDARPTGTAARPAGPKCSSCGKGRLCECMVTMGPNAVPLQKRYGEIQRAEGKACADRVSTTGAQAGDITLEAVVWNSSVQRGDILPVKHTPAVPMSFYTRGELPSSPYPVEDAVVISQLEEAVSNMRPFMEVYSVDVEYAGKAKRGQEAVKSQAPVPPDTDTFSVSFLGLESVSYSFLEYVMEKIGTRLCDVVFCSRGGRSCTSFSLYRASSRVPKKRAPVRRTLKRAIASLLAGKRKFSGV